MPDNPYIFGDPETDRLRLETQTRLIGERARTNARPFVGDQIHDILDLGCGEGQLGFVLREVYPQARLVGVDKDARAVATAATKAQERGLDQVEYLVGDAGASLPPGPFDLVFASLLLLHTPQPDKIIQAAFDVLRPGGYLWITDLDPNFREGYDSPAYKRLSDLLFATLAAIGAHPYIGNELPGMLTAAGFTDMRTKVEYYALGGLSSEARATLATLLGGFYNARGLISKTQGVPESEIEHLYTEIANAALHQTEEIGRMPSLNVVARRPPA